MKPSEVAIALCEFYPTHVAAAKACGVTPRTLNGWRRGVVLPGARTYRHVLDLLEGHLQEEPDDSVPFDLQAAALAYLDELCWPTCDQ